MKTDSKNLFFPYPQIGINQKRFYEDITISIQQKKVLLAQAAVGVGKTAAALSATLDIRNGTHRVFYTTPQTGQHPTILKEVRLLTQKSGRHIGIVDKISKQKMCRWEELRSNPNFAAICDAKCEANECNVQRSGKMPHPEFEEAIQNILKKQMSATEVADRIAGTACNICPHACAFRAFESASLVVCDLNYIFHPNIRERTLGIVKDFSNDILIVDEAHNLVPRMRSFYSKKITEGMLERAKKFLMDHEDRRAAAIVINALHDYLMKFDGQAHVKIPDFKRAYEGGLMKAWITKEQFISMMTLPENENVLLDEETDPLKSIREFIIEFLDEKNVNFSRYADIEIYSHGGKVIKKRSFNCTLLDVGGHINSVFEKFHAVILMSGTMEPFDDQVSMMHIPKERVMLRVYETDFDKAKRSCICDMSIESSFENRGNSIKPYAEKISGILNNSKTNVGVFFTSYSMLKAIEPLVKTKRKRYSELDCREGKLNKEHVIKMFLKSRNNVLFAVVGGSFNEGVNFMENSLPLIAICGIPYSNTKDLFLNDLKDYYDKSKRYGWRLVFQGAALNKTLQAAGRMIREEGDIGTLVLLDKRFVKFMPSHYKMKLVKDSVKELEA